MYTSVYFVEKVFSKFFLKIPNIAETWSFLSLLSSAGATSDDFSRFSFTFPVFFTTKLPFPNV